MKIFENNMHCNDIKITKEIANEVKKFNSAEDLLRSGGVSVKALDRAAFGFSEEDIKTLMPSQLHIKWNDDLENVKWEVEKQGGDKKEYANNIDLTKPIDVIYEDNGDGLKFYVDDGHHRYYAAKILNKPLNVNLKIKSNPILKLGNGMGYDDFHRCIFERVKNKNVKNLKEYDEYEENPIKNLKEISINGVFFHGSFIDLSNSESSFMETIESDYNDWGVFWITDQENIAEEFSEESNWGNEESSLNVIYEIKANCNKIANIYTHEAEEIKEYYGFFDFRESISILEEQGFNGWKTTGSIGRNIYDDYAIFDTSCLKGSKLKLKINNEWSDYMNLDKANKYLEEIKNKKSTSKVENIIKEEQENKHCDKYFDLDSIYQYTELDKPLYSVVSKKRTAKLLYMSPKQYIYTIAMHFGGLSYNDVVSSAAVSKEKIDKYAEDMKNGDKFPVPYYTKDKSLQEGRHRALAAMKLGCDKIPVIEFRNISSEEVEKFAMKFKNSDIFNKPDEISFKIINNLFIKRGFENGITKLGFYDLKRYIEYNLEAPDTEELNEIRKIIRNIIKKI